jgi:pyridinium-3,5-biscarboxylic acid mononucleotide sulfurtransferase
MGDLIIGFSGGVDSTLLVRVAHDVLGDRALAVTARSPSLPARELAETRELARQIGIRYMEIETQEVLDPRYAANPSNRCYYCKSELFAQLEQLAESLGFRWLAYGENEDDDADHRPGAAAARECGVRAPLREAGLTKADVRLLARHLGLPTWNKPALACLASRFPYGTAVTPERLGQVERAEDQLWALGFAGARVRFHGDVARIEVAPVDRERLLQLADQVVAGVKAVGFTYVAMDLQGYRRGALNEAWAPVQLGEELP